MSMLMTVSHLEVTEVNMHMDAATIEQLIHEIRMELGYDRGARPRVRMVVEAPDTSLHVITPDRAEKSMCLGPDGRVAAELAKRLSRRVTFYGDDELLVRRHRLDLTLARIEELMPQVTESQRVFLQVLASEIRIESSRPMSFPSREEIAHSGIQVAIAYSGGYDSTASAILLRVMGIAIIAVTVDIGDAFVSRIQNHRLVSLCKALGIEHVLIHPSSIFDEIVVRARQGRVHPCGQCHATILDQFMDNVVSRGIEVAVTGEMLPTGRQAILLERGVLLVHLPAALALSKYRMIEICESIGIKERLTFGCNLLKEVHQQGWSAMGPSIYRVMRELEAGVLTTGQALDYVKSIVRPSIRDHQESQEATD